MVKHTLKSLGPQVLATRMVHDYVHDMYAPAARSSRLVCADNYAGARELAAWQSRIAAAWPRLRVVNVDTIGLGDTPQVGTEITVRATLDLGTLSAEDVDVQVSYGPVDETDRLISPQRFSLRADGTVEGGIRFEGSILLDRAGSFGFAVHVLPRHPMMASGADLGLITTA